MDGHDRPDVLAHRKKWLEKEGRYELRQYLWLQLSLGKTLELCEQGLAGNDFRAQLENGKVTDTCASASLTCVEVVADGGVSKDILQERLRNDMVFHYFRNEQGEQVGEEDDAAQPWVELHVDLLPPEMRDTPTAIVNGLKIGGCLSVRFPEGMSPIVKVGGGTRLFLKCTARTKHTGRLTSLKSSHQSRRAKET